MSQTKLQAAKELIQEKDYDAARAVLRALPDDPTAIKWLAQLDQRYPKSEQVTPVASASNEKGGLNKWIVVAVFILVVVVGVMGYSVYEQNQAGHRSAAEYTCGLIYDRYSAQWQNCIDDKK